MRQFKQNLKATVSTMLIVSALVISWNKEARSGVLENLERERALVIKTILNPELSPVDRQKNLANHQLRLIDLERMVLRDNKLKGRNTPTVRKAFANYDLTFLLHASTEKNLSITDNWLSEIGLSTQNVMSAELKRKPGQNNE